MAVFALLSGAPFILAAILSWDDEDRGGSD
jgi:hypothetical protein